MKKFKHYLILVFVVSFISAQSQNYIYINNEKYEATNTWSFNSNSNLVSNPDVTIAKNGNKGYLMVSLERNTIEGDLIIFLEDGERINCINRNIRDNVDDKSIVIYNLTTNEINKLKTSLISKIRFSIRSVLRESKSYTASNNSKHKLLVVGKKQTNYYETTKEVSLLFSEGYSGEYLSKKTTFKSEINPKENFTENSLFNIAVVLSIDNNDGKIIIQDERIPENLLLYRIINLKEVIELKGYDITVYNCVNDDTGEKNQAVFYSDEDGLRLMIANAESAQTWHNLK